jgi:hypothetical protein
VGPSETERLEGCRPGNIIRTRRIAAIKPRARLRASVSVLHVGYFDGVPEGTKKILDRTIQRRADLRFGIGVPLALALPPFIGGVYVAAESLLLKAS